MLLVLLIFGTLTLQAYLHYWWPSASGNALNEKWRMYERARNDYTYDRNHRFFQLSES